MFVRLAARSGVRLTGVARPAAWQQPLSARRCVLGLLGTRKQSDSKNNPRNAFEALALLQRELGSDAEEAKDDSDPDEERIVHVGIIGEPNVGKSSLLNLLVNSPVSAVSPKRNTTRESIAGVHIHNNTQIVFHDTPGFMKKEVRATAVVHTCWAGCLFFWLHFGWVVRSLCFRVQVARV